MDASDLSFVKTIAILKRVMNFSWRSSCLANLVMARGVIIRILLMAKAMFVVANPHTVNIQGVSSKRLLPLSWVPGNLASLGVTPSSV
jgi:hypothetical protein